LALAFAARPATVLGMNGTALQHSVGREGLAEKSGESCRHIRGSVWTCNRHDDQFSGTVSYHVTVDGVGCREADRFGPPGEGSKKHISGCVTLLAYLFD
jgi:hypothetical protein